jgi:hypothetical protein
MARADQGRVPAHSSPWEPSISVPFAASFPDARCYRLTGLNVPGYPTAGGDIDGAHAIMEDGGDRVVYYLFPACPGGQVQVECSTSVSAGSLLETTSDGRVKPRGTGLGVLRALQAGSAGDLVWCVFTSGR